MIRKITLLFLACLYLYSPSFAQPRCGFDVMHNKKMQTDPSYAQNFNQFNTSVANWVIQHPELMVPVSGGNNAWEIPVVVHVIHTGQSVGTTYNPSDAAIQNLIQYLSDAFQAQYSGHLTEPNGGVRIPIVFKLAQRSPSCAATGGIVRINASSDATYAADGVSNDFPTEPGIDDPDLKSKSYWPNTEYYNIWLVNKINGANASSGGGPYVAGYAYLPSFAGPTPIDGTVMLADQVQVGNEVITHELGHAFNLLHVFAGTCPPQSGCLFNGDYVCDTEPQPQSPFNCPTTTNPCTGVAFGNGPRNFMDYSNCQDRFTTGQRARVVASLMYTGGYSPSTGGRIRSSLVSSLGATPLPSTPMVTPACTPTGGTVGTDFGPRAVTITKTGPGFGAPDTVIMNALSDGYQDDPTYPSHYWDRSCQHRAELRAGATYNFRVTVGSAEFVRAYIDFNNDGDFVDANETIYSPVNAFGGNGGYVTLTVPSSGVVYCTPVRMRVVTNSGAAPGSCGGPIGVISGQCEDYQVVIRGGTNTVPTTGIIEIPNPPINGNPSCLGSTIILAAPHPSSMAPVWYGWYRKTTSSGTFTLTYSSTTDSTWSSNIFTNLDTVFVKVGYPGLCGVDTTISDSIVLFRPVTIPPSVTIGITSGSNPTCVDDTVTLSIIANSNPGGAPTYQWRRNGNPITGATGTSYKVIGGTSGDVYSVVMTSSAGAPCAIPSTATSNNVPITHTQKTPTVTIALTTGTNPGCTGQMVTFSVMAKTTAGTTPTFAWFVNGILQTGVTGQSFTTAALNNNDVVTCQMTSSSPCALVGTVTSNAITYTTTTIIADVSIMQTFGGDPLCSGHRADFTALVVNGGPTPQFQWLVNNAPVLGANNVSFSTMTLVNGDVVKCVLVSSDPCVVNTLDTSAGITVNVTTSLVPTVSFSITKGNNPGCLDSLIEFTATATNMGSNPNFDWFVNDIGPFFNGNVLSINTLLNGDKVTVRVNQTDGGCYLPDTLFSAPMFMTLSPTPNPPIISLIGNMLVANKSGAFVWFGPGGQLTGSSSNQYHPTELGAYWCVTDNNGCWSKPSNILTITLLDINDINIENVDIFPNPTTGELTLDWKHTVNMKIDVFSTVGQKLLHDEMKNQARKTINLSGLANGIYFVVMTDEHGKSGTARVTVNK